ncbi:hypothetical protein E3E31_04210 [Thermococcus sp. M39]|nr:MULTISPECIES: hypothetical protein [unclassified Thermococcus]NJE07733.1 hypothetical protein [Thermococcus sp. M39]NJE12289.1 hypothetical protein [Thermococcus sp. LS2]
MQEWYQSRALYEAISKLISNRDFKTAVQVAETIPDKGIKAKALSKITVEMARLGEDYQDILKKTLDSIFEMGRDDSITKALMSLAFEFLNLDLIDDALKIASMIKDVSSRSKIQAEVAIALAKKGKIPEALKIINDILDDDVKTWATSRLAAGLNQRREED